jgi:hypothetical protein
LSFGIVRAIPLGSSSSLEDDFDTIEAFQSTRSSIDLRRQGPYSSI